MRSPGKSLDYGYAFVNIEIANGQFVTVSAYLESTSKATRPFIVQAGLTIEQDDSAMSKPLYAIDFQDDECIIPLDDIIEYMEEKDLVFKRMGNAFLIFTKYSIKIKYSLLTSPIKIKHQKIMQK